MALKLDIQVYFRKKYKQAAYLFQHILRLSNVKLLCPEPPQVEVVVILRLVW